MSWRQNKQLIISSILLLIVFFIPYLSIFLAFFILPFFIWGLFKLNVVNNQFKNNNKFVRFALLPASFYSGIFIVYAILAGIYSMAVSPVDTTNTNQVAGVQDSVSSSSVEAPKPEKSEEELAAERKAREEAAQAEVARQQQAKAAEDAYNAERIKQRDLRATYKKEFGNIYMAAQQAEAIKNIAGETDLDFFVFVDAADDQIARYNDGHPEAQLREKIYGVRLGIFVDSTEWAVTAESTKKDFITVMYSQIKQYYPDVASVRVIVNNGIREVAVGSPDAFNGGVKVEFK